MTLNDDGRERWGYSGMGGVTVGGVGGVTVHGVG